MISAQVGRPPGAYDLLADLQTPSPFMLPAGHYSEYDLLNNLQPWLPFYLSLILDFGLQIAHGRCFVFRQCSRGEENADGLIQAIPYFGLGLD